MQLKRISNEKSRIHNQPYFRTVSKAGIPEAIDKYLDKSKYSYEIVETHYAGHAEELAKKAAAKGVEVVVAIGGDGTVNEVARGITHTSTALGIIPCGSGNGLARHLLIPINIKKSLEIINECKIHDLDYCNINGHDFFCTCGMGFDAFISFKFAEAGKRGPITYFQQVLETALSINLRPMSSAQMRTQQLIKRFLSLVPMHRSTATMLTSPHKPA